jgi:hypothetical protein
LNRYILSWGILARGKLGERLVRGRVAQGLREGWQIERPLFKFLEPALNAILDS